ncbi:MAG: insulinase family protein [Bacteroidetes bacterium]|nr:insulinase family protein [Bacteroidota bacterium]
MQKEFIQLTLKNGIRVIHKQTTDEVAHCGIIINAGSRDEGENEQGIAHLIEHVLFKGTKKRKAFHILNRIDSVGGELNAYTTKEETCIYASFLARYFERSVELISDIAFHSTFPDKEIKKEKAVIVDEINSYLDNPSEQIFDDFDEQIFAKHPLGKNILGTPQSLKSISRKDILNFVQRNYSANQLVFCSIGNVEEDALKRILEEHLGGVKLKQSEQNRAVFKNYKASEVELKKDTNQSHCILGNIAYGVHHKDRTALVLVNNLLGGPAMNSRLNLAIREKYGFTYNLESNYAIFTDTGLFSVYMGTDSKYLERCVELVQKELTLLKTKSLGSMQLQTAKQQLIGNIALAQESKVNLMLSLGKSILLFNKVDKLSDIYKKIESISAQKILDISNQVFETKQLSRLTYLSK